MSGSVNGNGRETAGIQREVQETCSKLDKLVAEKSTGSEEVVELLKALEKLPIDLDILQNTNVGKSVNTLRKETQSEQVASLCKNLVKSWKSLLKVNSGSSPHDGSDSPGQSQSAPAKKEARPAPGGATAQSESQRKRLKTQLSESGAPRSPLAGASPDPAATPASLSRSSSTGSVPANDANGRATAATASSKNGEGSGLDTSDPNRLKSRELIVKALSKEALVEGAQDPGQLAGEIETAIYQEFHGVDTRYKNRIRSRVMNLQDSRNPSLRENVLLGMISCQRFATMSSEEMASEEMKTLRQKYTTEAINDRQMATQQGVESDLLQCGKCKQRKCTYTQAQTRSADEPMTTFALCLTCGNRWKFC
ncbi:transcription elongation factor S-II-like [Paramacrobiotus metropolitanus]|uniref:transcription elongation factor S-II-like n=1 Tax=Paramacrobiotus metropolitanus TaxID=2943436 RepID=UPI002445A817|nr:transcription elongation factor S-II-like [Paramacrobiotus metropolitanus]